MSRLLPITITILLMLIPFAVSAQVVVTPDEEEQEVERDNYAYTSGDVGVPKMLHLRTNLLYDLALLPNAGVEMAIGRNWTLLAEGTFNWIGSNAKHRYWRIGSLGLEARYWPGGPMSALMHRGHHWGLYATAARYDVEFGGKGYQADFNCGGGISYGYSAPIARKLSLDFGLTVGYLGGKYKEYKPIDSHYVWQDDKTLNYFGPIKAEIALVWHIELHKKGGVEW